MSRVRKEKSFLSGALVLIVFGLLSKLVGAIYRIPLTRIVGAEGMGIYQMVFPLYTLMLTISSSSIPSSISKLISENIAKNNYKQAKRILSVSFLLLVCFSCVCALFVFLFAGKISLIQGNFDAKICYYGLAPAILFVGMISGFRGWFQGIQNMYPTAISGFIEQVVKMICGLSLSYYLVQKGVNYGVLGAVLGISISELIALIYLYIHYLFFRKKEVLIFRIKEGNLLSKRETAKSILSLSIFIILGGLIMPLTMLIDSSVVINILKSIGYSTKDATALFGLQTGTVGSIINMPVVLSLGVATSILPCVSSFKASGDFYNVRKSCTKAILITLILALPSAIGCCVYSEPIIRILYGGSLNENEISIAVNLLEIASFSVFYLALVQVCSGLLQGLGRFKIPLIALGCGAVIKIILNLTLVRIECINILGAEISSVVCYIVALFINLIILKKEKVLALPMKTLLIIPLCAVIYLSKFIFDIIVSASVNYFLAFLMVFFVVVLIYFCFVWFLFKKNLIENKM